LCTVRLGPNWHAGGAAAFSLSLVFINEPGGQEGCIVKEEPGRFPVPGFAFDFRYFRFVLKRDLTVIAIAVASLRVNVMVNIHCLLSRPGRWPGAKRASCLGPPSSPLGQHQQ